MCMDYLLFKKSNSLSDSSWTNWLKVIEYAFTVVKKLSSRLLLDYSL